MKTIEIKLYQFDELSDEAKQKAIENMSDINVDHDWWDFIYKDATNVELKITDFDISRYSCNANFIDCAKICAEKIMDEYGVTCAIFHTAKNFLIEKANLIKKYSDGINVLIVAEGKEYNFDQEIDELENDFLISLCKDYLKILRDEYEYLISKEAIIETIEANEYFFTENGKLY